MMQGTENILGGGSSRADGSAYEDVYAILPHLSPFAMGLTNLTFDPVGLTATVDLEIQVVSPTDPEDATNTNIWAVIYEDGLVDSETPPATHDFVARDVTHPDRARPAPWTEPLTALSVGATQNVTFTFSLLTDWVTSNMNVIAWIQDDDTKAIRQATSTLSPPLPTYGLGFAPGEQVGMTPVDTTLNMEDFTVSNTGSVADTYTARLIVDRAPVGWTAEITDGVASNPTELTVTLAPPPGPGDSQAFHLVVTPDSLGYARYHVELFQDGAPTSVSTIRYTVVTEALDILLVDDDGGAAQETLYTDAFDTLGVTYGVWPLEDGQVTAADLSTMCQVHWNVGDATPTLTQPDRDALETFLLSGGRLFISGADLGRDLVEDGDAASQAWYRTYLLATYGRDDAGVLRVDGVPADPIGDGLSFDLGASAPDVITADAGADAAFTYSTGETAGLSAAAGAYKLVYLAFGYSDVTDAGLRGTLMQRVVGWLDLCAPPACLLGRPARVTSLKAHREGPDVVFAWDGDPAAEDGFNIYSTDDKSLLTDKLNGVSYSPILAEEPGPTARYLGGVDSGAKYYQVLGVCGGTTESEN